MKERRMKILNTYILRNQKKIRILFVEKMKRSVQDTLVIGVEKPNFICLSCVEC